MCRILGTGADLCGGRFPRTVRIETTNACNARCTICPHQRLQRPRATIDQARFRQAVDECAAAGCREVHLHNFGEPLMDPELEDRVAYAKQRGIPKVKIFCNGSLLDGRRASGLLAAGLDEIKISFDGATREEFERIRVPLRFDRVVENVRELVRLRDAQGARLRIYVACCSTSDREQTMQALEELVDGFSFGKIHNWTGDGVVSPQRARRRLRKPCMRLWRTLTVLAGGEVALCCLDYDGRHVLGRLDAGTSLAEIWRGPAYRHVRQLHRAARQDGIDLCRACTKAFL